MAAPFEIKKVTVDAVSWTAITVPFDCSRVTVRQSDGTNDAKLRTDSADSNTEDTIPAGLTYLMPGEAPAFMPYENQLRARHLWKTGATVCFIQAAAGTGPIIAGFKQ